MGKSSLAERFRRRLTDNLSVHTCDQIFDATPMIGWLKIAQGVVTRS